jgi:hypothetical protein
MNGNCHYQECDGRTDGEPDGHHQTIIRPVFNGRIKMVSPVVGPLFKLESSLCQELSIYVNLRFTSKKREFAPCQEIFM